MSLGQGHGVKHDHKVIHSLREGLSDSVVRFEMDGRPKLERIFTYTCPQIVQLRSAAHEVTGIERTVDATTARSQYTLNRNLFHRPIRLDAGAVCWCRLLTRHVTVALLMWAIVWFKSGQCRRILDRETIRHIIYIDDLL